MGYSIIDIKGGTCLSMPSMAAVCAWWNTKFKVSLLSELGSEWFFRELNITGKDIKANGELRQFQIRDEFGRPVDIRTWSDQTWETNQPAFDWGSFPHFGKRHLHRVGGPKMRLQTLRTLINGVDLGDVEQAIVLDKSRPTRKSKDCSCRWTSDTRRYWNRAHVSPSRCWKDQTKAKRQYARHLPAPEILPGKHAGEDLAIIQARLGAGLVESAHFTPDSFEKAV